jgi:hypothetical protein
MLANLEPRLSDPDQGKRTKGNLGMTTPNVARKLMVKYVKS